MKSVQKPGTASLYVIHVTRNSTTLVFPWRFHLEQLIKEMEGRARDLLDVMATVTVPVAKEDEVKCLQCVWYMVKWWIPNAGSWILSKNSWLSSVVLNTPILRCISFYWLKAISKKYDLSSKLLQNERNAIFTSFFLVKQNQNLETTSAYKFHNVNLPYLSFIRKKKSLAWFSKLNHVQCEILRLKYTIARVLCTQQE